MNCTCVECYENRMLEVLEGPIAIYMSMKYRALEAECPVCGEPNCAKALYHGDPCSSIGDDSL